MKQDRILKIIIIVLVCVMAVLLGLAVYGKVSGNRGAGSGDESAYINQELDFSELYAEGNLLKTEAGFKVTDNGHLRITGNDDTYVLTLGKMDFGKTPVDKLIIDAMAAEGTDAVLRMYLGKSEEPFLELDLPEESRDNYSLAKDELMIDVSGTGIEGRKSIRLEIVIEGDGEFELRNLEFKTASIPTLYFDLDESLGTIEDMNKDKDNSCTGSLLISIPEGYESQYTDGKLEDLVCDVETIHGRGNSTWDCDKKPYTMKLAEKEDLFGMGSAKKWVLLANYYDKSLMRSKLAYDLAGEMGMEYAVQSVFVDVVMNNRYAGSYQLAEKIEVKKNRVDINDLDDFSGATDEAAINGGYLLELYPAERVVEENEKVYFWSYEWNKGVVIESPSLEENFNEAQYNYIMEYYHDFEEAVYSSDFCTEDGVRYTDLVDIDSFVDFYVVQELFKNNDALYASTFLYKDIDEKLCIGPIWDMDLTAGTYACNYTESPQGFFINGQYFFGQLVRDPEFVRKVIERYYEIHDYIVSMYEPEKEGGLSKIRQYEQLLDDSQQMNFDKWGMGNRGWNAVLCQGSYEAEVDYLEDWLEKRVAWLDENIEEMMPEGTSVVTFMNGDDEFAKVLAPYNSTVAPADAPEREDKEFAGWIYFDDNGHQHEFTSATVVTGDMTVLADWK